MVASRLSRNSASSPKYLLSENPIRAAITSIEIPAIT